MAGMAWQTTHVDGTYKMPVPINAIKTFQQPLVGQKQKDQTCSLVKKHASHYTKTGLHNMNMYMNYGRDGLADYTCRRNT